MHKGQLNKQIDTLSQKKGLVEVGQCDYVPGVTNVKVETAPVPWWDSMTAIGVQTRAVDTNV